MATASSLRAPLAVRAAARRSRTLRQAAVAVRHRRLNAEDVFLASYPRSGNTWLRFLLADISLGRSVGFEELDRVIPAVGFHDGAPALVGAGRMIKTHERHRGAYERSVYLVRDVRDVLVSWYRVSREDADDFTGFDGFVHDFMSDRASPYGSWLDHVNHWRAAKRRGSRIIIRRFEDLRAEPAAVLEDVLAFAGAKVDRTRIEEAVRRNTASELHRLERESRNYLRRAFGYRSRGIRDGRGGEWRELLDPRMLLTLEPALRVNEELGYTGI